MMPPRFTLSVLVILGSFDVAEARGSSDDKAMVQLLIAGLVVVIGIVAWLVSQANAPHRVEPDPDRSAQLQREANAWADRFAGGIRSVPTRLLLRDGEVALLDEPSILFESRSFRIYGGAGTRVGGIYVGGGASESQQRLKQIDLGTLTLTTKRLVFDGERENRSVPMSQVLSVRPWADAIEVSSERRSKSQIYRVANPIIWCSAVKAAAEGKFAVHRGEQS
jgi:hypothetical protein